LSNRYKIYWKPITQLYYRAIKCKVVICRLVGDKVLLFSIYIIYKPVKYITYFVSFFNREDIGVLKHNDWTRG
jgi:hypothetical protein